MPDTFLASYLDIYALLQPRQVLSAQDRLERLATPPLEEHPTLFICVEIYFALPTMEDRKVLDFSQYMRLIQIPTTVTTPHKWLE